MRQTRFDGKPIAEKYGISEDEVQNIYRYTFEFIHNTASSFDFSVLTDDELDKMKTSFQLPGLGKLYLDRIKLNKYREKWKKI